MRETSELSVPPPSPPPPSPARRAYRLALLCVLCATFAVAAACMARVPGVSAPPPEPGRGVTVHGARGPVAPAQQQRDLARVAAEGRPQLLQHHLAVLAAQDDVHLYRGNTAALLVDGPATFAAMKAAISQARGRVLLESYIVEGEGVAAELLGLLLHKAGQGVEVALMYDAVGSLQTPAAVFDRLRAGGIAVCAFNPVNPLERPGRWGLLQRSHRKLLVVDAEVAFTGGINLSDVYSSGSRGSSGGSSGRGGSGGSGAGLDPSSRARDPDTGDPAIGGPAAAGAGWRDTQIELRGPVVTAMAVVFRESWQAQGCPGVPRPPPPAVTASPGQRVVQLVAGDPRAGLNPTYVTLLAATRAAVRSVHVTMAYFAPGREFVDALAAAARRGVAVRLVLPGRSDVQLVQHAGRSYYAQLLEAGVQIHEMSHTVMHAKTAVIDGVLSTVGSSNLDWRSIVGNNEMDIIVLGEDFGQAMESLFERDVALSQSIDPERWQRRAWSQRVLEMLGRWVEPWL